MSSPRRRNEWHQTKGCWTRSIGERGARVLTAAALHAGVQAKELGPRQVDRGLQADPPGRFDLGHRDRGEGARRAGRAEHQVQAA